MHRFTNTVTLLAAGTCTLTANQAGNDDYEAASEITEDITVSFNPARPALTRLPQPAKHWAMPPFSVTVTGGTPAMMWYWAAVRPMCVPFPATPLPCWRRVHALTANQASQRRLRKNPASEVTKTSP
ncbi:MAG: hypothetical protein R3F02_19590 [Thiolinea sp.]